MSTLGERIRNIRGKTSQMQFSASLGIAQTKLSRYERGTTSPDLDFLVQLSRQYAVDLEWLITGAKTAAPAGTPQQGMVPECVSQCGEMAGQNYIRECENLKKELAEEREERRDVTRENRQLWKENAALREELARLQERANAPVVLGVSTAAGSVA